MKHKRSLRPNFNQLSMPDLNTDDSDSVEWEEESVDEMINGVFDKYQSERQFTGIIYRVIDVGPNIQ